MDCLNAVLVLGGFYPTDTRNVNYYKTVEKYDINRDKWMQLADLNFPRAEAKSICHRGFIYVFGGTTPKNVSTNTLERIRVTDLEF